MRHRLPSFCLAGVFALGACGSGNLLGPPFQGVDGLVLIGPVCPVQTVGDPCPDQPFHARIEVSSSSDASLTWVQSDEEGRFRLGLRPGTYRLRAEQRVILFSQRRYPPPVEQTIVVERGRYTSVVFTFDSGIR